MPVAIRLALARTLFAAVLVTLHPEASTAQWMQTSGPRGGGIRSLLAVPLGGGGTNLFAGQLFVWRTSDRGVTWTQFQNGLTDPAAFSLIAVPDGAGGHDVLVSTQTGVFRSTDNGGNWSAIHNGIPDNLSVYALASGSNGSGGTNLYAGTYLGRFFRSTDNGANWTEVGSGLPTGQAHIQALITAPGGTILAGTGNGIYRSTNFGATFTRVFTLYGLSLAKHGSTLYAGTSNGVYRSTDDGATWTAINNGMGFNWVNTLAAVPNGTGVVLFANFMRSIDGGATWTFMNNTGLVIPVARAYAHAPNASGGTDVYVGTDRGVLRSSNFGGNWTDVSFIYSQVQAVEATPSGAILAGTENEIFRTTDAGQTWTDTRSMTTALDFAVNRTSPSGTSVFAGSSPAGIYKSSDDGTTWAQSSNGLDDFDVNSVGAIPNGSGGTNLLAGTASELFISMDDGGFWQRANLQTLALDYTVTPNGTGGHNVWAAGYGGVWLSTNYGTAWTPASNGIAGFIVQGIASTANGANLFAGGTPFGVFRSTNNGASWTAANNGIIDTRISTVFSPDGANVFAAGAGGVYVSTDHGNSWTAVSTGLTTGVYQLAVSLDATTLIAGTAGAGVWKRPLAEMVAGAPPPPPPPPAPVIASFSPGGGSAGTVVTLTGSNFTGASAVTFNLVASTYTVDSPAQITATVPAGATTGRIRVTTPGGTAASASDFSVTAPPPPSTLTFTPPHDAWVRSSTPSSNFGSRPELIVKGGSQVIRSYLKFVVSGVSGQVQGARLRLRVNDASSDGGFVYSVSNNFAGTTTPWTESGLTWNNAPALGAVHGWAGRPVLNAWVEVDVTGAITGNGTYSFAVSSSVKDQVGYSSSEGANPPQLVVIMSESSSPALREAAATTGETLPGHTVLFANHPNPFDAGTTFRYSLPHATHVRLVVYDVAGRAVRTLADGLEPAGERRVEWDARDADGTLVRAGMYLLRLEAGATRLTRKLSVMR